MVALKPERCGKESVVGHAGVQPVENGAHIDLAASAWTVMVCGPRAPTRPFLLAQRPALGHAPKREPGYTFEGFPSPAVTWGATPSHARFHSNALGATGVPRQAQLARRRCIVRHEHGPSVEGEAFSAKEEVEPVEQVRRSWSKLGLHRRDGRIQGARL